MEGNDSLFFLIVFRFVFKPLMIIQHFKL